MQRSFVLLLVLAFGSLALSAQTPPPRPAQPPAPRVMSMSMPFSGSFLGVETADVSSDNYASYGLASVRGVAVKKVVEGSPAEAAGLRAGDVIVRFNGEEVTSTRKLTRLIGEVSPDHSVRLTVVRGGSETEIAATIGKRPMPQFENGRFRIQVPDGEGFEFQMPELPEIPRIENFPMPRGGDGDVFVFRTAGSRQIGVGLTPLTKQLAAHFGVEKGVMINNVHEGSPAEKAGLRAGDIIVAVDGKEISNEMEVVRGISAKKEGDVELGIVRDRNRQTIRVAPEAATGYPDNFFSVPAPPRAPRTPATPAAPRPMGEFFFPGRVV